MSESTLKRLLIAVAVLVVLYAGVRAASAIARPRTDAGALGDALERVRGDSLESVVTVAPWGERVELRRQSGRWTVDGFPADSLAVDRLMTAVREASVVDLVARRTDTHRRLGVAADSAWQLELRTRDDTVRLLVGGSGRVYSNTYVRLPDEDAVYEIRGDLRGSATRTRDAWRDHTIVRIDTSAVRRVVVERGRARHELTRTDSTWRVGSDTADTFRARDLLMELAHFTASGFAADSVEFTGRETRRVTALGEKGDTLGTIEFAGDSTTWLARVPGGTTLFQVSPYRVDRIAPARADLVKKN
ncbi:MAG TPA: DUF4340 domain-containing protein [Gemmatimonadaceae bacterium]